MYFFNYQSMSPSYDILTFEMLRLSDKLVRFELYGRYCTNFETGQINWNAESSSFIPTDMDIIKFLRAITPIFFFNRKTIEKERSSIRRRQSKFAKND